MINYLIVVFFFNVIFIAIIKKNATNWGLIDTPNERSMHIKPTPKGAGIAFYVVFLLSSSIFYTDFMLTYLWAVIAISSIFILGLVDDYYGVSPKIKFLILILSTVILSFNNLIIYDIGTFWGISMTLSYFALPFTIFVVIGFTNAINLIDGLDGLSSMITLVIFIVFLWIGYYYKDFFLFIFSLTFITILIGFLFFNWSPASIFMGDSGSLMLGFILSILAIKSLAYIPAISILFIGAIPILDTLIVMLRRKRSAKSLCMADSCHLHHIVKYYFKGSTPKSVVFLVSIQMIYILIGLGFEKGIDQGLILIFFLMNIIFVYNLVNIMIAKAEIVC